MPEGVDLHPLEIKTDGATEYDIVSLGEVMLRLDPGDRPIAGARVFEAWEGGGEYNVARAASAVFGLRSAVVTALVDNAVGRLIVRLIGEGGVDTRFVTWLPFDGIGKKVRNPLNFTERGFGVRAARGVSDRASSAASQNVLEAVGWDDVFFKYGTRWFHTGGIFTALSEESAQAAMNAIARARDSGAVVSYDLNYRPSLWQDRGGRQAARELNAKLATMVDVLVGNEEDYGDCLGIEVPRVKDVDRVEEREGFAEILLEARRQYPGVKVTLMTLRKVLSASRNDWSAIGIAGDALYKGRMFHGLEIYDRIGGGDGFISAFAAAMLEGKDFSRAIDEGIAHGALVMTTPGDVSMATKDDVERLAGGSAPRVIR